MEELARLHRNLKSRTHSIPSHSWMAPTTLSGRLAPQLRSIKHKIRVASASIITIIQQKWRQYTCAHIIYLKSLGHVHWRHNRHATTRHNTECKLEHHHIHEPNQTPHAHWKTTVRRHKHMIKWSDYVIKHRSNTCIQWE